MRSPLRWFYDLLNHGPPPFEDPDDVVEAAYMSLIEGQMVVGRLQGEGLAVSLAETRNNPYMSQPMARVFCRAGDLEIVRRLVDETVDDTTEQ